MSPERKTPHAMASQHPDHAGVPFWNTREFISTKSELREAYEMFSVLNIPEIK